MAVVADAEQLDIHAAPVFDLALIRLAHGRDIGGKAVGNDGVLRLDGNMVKQIFLHEPAVTLRMVGCKALVLVKIGRAHTAEIDQPGLFAGDQLTIQRQRGAGGKTDNAGGLGMDDGFKFIGSSLAHFFRGLYFDDIQVQHNLFLLYFSFFASSATIFCISFHFFSMSATSLNWVRARSRFWPSRWTAK